MSLWCCAQFNVRREREKSKQGIVSASIHKQPPRPARRLRRDISIDPCFLTLSTIFLVSNSR